MINEAPYKTFAKTNRLYPKNTKNRDGIVEKKKNAFRELQSGIFFAGIEVYLPFFQDLEIPLQHAPSYFGDQKRYIKNIQNDQLIRHRFDGLDDLDKPLIFTT